MTYLARRMVDIASAGGRVTIHVRYSRLREVVTDCFVRSVMVVAASKWIGLVQLVDTIEVVTSGKTPDEGFHPCLAWNIGLDRFQSLSR